LGSVSRSHFRLEAAGALSGKYANTPLPVFSLGAKCGKKMNVVNESDFVGLSGGGLVE